MENKNPTESEVNQKQSSVTSFSKLGTRKSSKIYDP